jgi:hypothetical protein
MPHNTQGPTDIQEVVKRPKIILAWQHDRYANWVNGSPIKDVDQGTKHLTVL